MDPVNLRVLMVLHSINDPDAVANDDVVQVIGSLVKVILSANPVAARGAWIAWRQARGAMQDQRSLEAQWNSLDYDFSGTTQQHAFALLEMQAALYHRKTTPTTAT